MTERQKEKQPSLADQGRDKNPMKEIIMDNKEKEGNVLQELLTKRNHESEENLKSTNSKLSMSRKEQKKMETVEDLKTQLEMLMHSLATLSAEKSKMEANFQADRKQLRVEREQYEKTVADLRDKWKKLQNHSQSEMEHLKYKLILERHEREKEQSQHTAMMKELQRLMRNERQVKEQLEAEVKELKIQTLNKSQNKVLEAELEILKNKLKQSETAAKGSSPLLLSLQSEMADIKRQHRNAIQEEQKRVAAAEQQTRVLAMTHEARVAGLEARLTELSRTVGGYDRLRQKDQQAIQTLKSQLLSLQNADNKDYKNANISNDPKKIVTSIKELCMLLKDIEKDGFYSIIKDVFKSFQLSDGNGDVEWKQKYDALHQEFEDYKKQVVPVSSGDSFSETQTTLQSNCNNKDNSDNASDNGQLSRLKTHCSNLEERIRLLNNELISRDKEHNQKSESLQEERLKNERLLLQKENEHRGKILTLEQQILRQRQRSLAVIDEKDQEIQTLKSSFQALLPKNVNALAIEKKTMSSVQEMVNEHSTDLVTGLLSADSNPPMLHYAQELARREVQVSGLWKQNIELEAIIRQKERELLSVTEKHTEEMKNAQFQIERLKACKSREGANLEYLKNVFVNYLVSTDASSKRHMLNAIATVLRFTSEEMEKTRRCK